MRQMGNVARLMGSLACVLSASAVARGDMVPVSMKDPGSSAIRTTLPQSSDSRTAFQYQGFAYLELRSNKFIDAGTDQDASSLPQDVQVLSDDMSSLTLCMSALLSMGLYYSAHHMRKFSLSNIPEWYHSGGPLQIGHGLAIAPENISLSPVCIFEQPVVATRTLIPDLRHGIIASLWRESQFTPDAVAPRGPPHLA